MDAPEKPAEIDFYSGDEPASALPVIIRHTRKFFDSLRKRKLEQHVIALPAEEPDGSPYWFISNHVSTNVGLSICASVLGNIIAQIEHRLRQDHVRSCAGCREQNLEYHRIATQAQATLQTVTGAPARKPHA